jgi:protein EFR3
LVKDEPSSPYLMDLRSRPAVERRAASIHAHVDGENGPSAEDVVRASLRGLYCLVEHANGTQLGFVMQSLFEHLDAAGGWDDAERCSWLSLKIVEWSQYQYRYAVPTWLVDRLCRLEDNKKDGNTLHALTLMITSIFNSPVPLVNLSTSDIMANLTSLLLRKVEIEGDPLTSELVESVSSLGRHIYYSDQIQDLAVSLRMPLKKSLLTVCRESSSTG